MICWLYGNEMKELKFVKGDYTCTNCGGSYCNVNNHYNFFDSNENIISEPQHPEAIKERESWLKSLM